MEVLIIDDDNISLLLEVEGYDQEQIEAAYMNIKKQFLDAFELVFSRALTIERFPTIILQFVQSSNQELDGNGLVRLASFNSEISDSDNLYFDVCETSLRVVLSKGITEEFRDTATHEMIHAADQSMLKRNSTILKSLMDEILYDCESEKDQLYGNALFHILRLMSLYRSEGIAILGSHLSLGQKFGCYKEALKLFADVFNISLMMTYKRIPNPEDSKVCEFDDFSRATAYRVSPYIILQVMVKLNMIDSELAAMAINILDEGGVLPEGAVTSIVRAAMSLSLSDYIHGVLLLGDEVAPLQPFLETCAMLQDDYDKDSIKAFLRMVQKSDGVEIFSNAMKRIMGSLMKVGELEELYKTFIEGPSDVVEYTGMKSNIDWLYSVMKNDPNETNQCIARWALTYFFDDMDIIHDDIKGLGYVDDAIVLDYAVRLVKECGGTADAVV